MDTRSLSRVRRFGPPALIVALAAGAVALGAPLLGADGATTVADPRIPLYLLAGCWALFQLVVLYLQFGRDLDNTIYLSLTEIALALGLLFATPLDLVVASVGTLAVINALRRRQDPLKQVFNTASRAFNVVLALWLYQALVPDNPLSTLGWAALCLVLTISGLASTLAVAAAICLSTAHLPAWSDIRSQVMWAVTTSLWSATLAFAVGLALQVGTTAVAPLLLLLAALGVMVHEVSLLTERHMHLASIHSLGKRLTSARDVESILRTALDTCTDLLMARRAEAFVPSPDDPHELRRVSQALDGALAQTTVERTDLPRARGVLDGRDGVVAAAPLSLGNEVVLSVSGHTGTMRPFGPKDARLLDMVAHQAGANLSNAHLIQQLRHDALHDPLTDLPNRRSLLETIEERLVLGTPVRLVWLGIRDLQDVNAALGHATGDELLTQVGHRLADAAGPDAFVGRVGGDEFAILLPSGEDRALSPDPVDVLLATLSQPLKLSRVQVLVRASVGVVVEPGGSGVTADDVLRRADIAMRFAQRTGREVEHYTPTLEKATSAALTLAVDLRTGITDDELVLFAQPQVRLDDGAVTGVEILVRWNHPTMGLLSPAQFIPLAEQTGLDWPMTHWVLNSALEQLTRWDAAGVGLYVAVNVSANALCDGRLCQLTEELLTRHGVRGEQLVIEVTESSLLTNAAMAAETLNGLAALGVRVSIDDFGTGFSSLSHLRRLPVDEIKIDMSFVRTMLEDADDAAIVRSVISLAKDLGLACVAEGVEDEHVYGELRRLGCDFAQGYHMAAPMPVDDIVGWLQPSPGALGSVGSG